MRELLALGYQDAYPIVLLIAPIWPLPHSLGEAPDKRVVMAYNSAVGLSNG